MCDNMDERSCCRYVAMVIVKYGCVLIQVRVGLLLFFVRVVPCTCGVLYIL